VAFVAHHRNLGGRGLLDLARSTTRSSKYVTSSRIEVLHGPCVMPSGSALGDSSVASPPRLVPLGRGVPGKGTEDAMRAVGIAPRRGVAVELRLVGGMKDDDLERLRLLAMSEGTADAVEVVGRVRDPAVEPSRRAPPDSVSACTRAPASSSSARPPARSLQVCDIELEPPHLVGPRECRQRGLGTTAPEAVNEVPGAARVIW
jgi:glycosyltransferase involved in cell wall biosynthesis